MAAECVICFDQIESHEIHKLSCDHEFCMKCLTNIKFNNRESILSCPLCRNNVFEQVRCLICHTTLYDLCIECSTKEHHEECLVYIGKCEHKFHTHCIEEWVANGGKNPIPSCQDCLSYMDK